MESSTEYLNKWGFFKIKVQNSVITLSSIYNRDKKTNEEKDKNKNRARARDEREGEGEGGRGTEKNCRCA